MPALEGGVRITGIKELVRDLETLGVDVADLKAAFAKLSAAAAAAASGFAPSRTGRLAASIRGTKAKNYAAVAAGGARVPYAGAINYGWRRRSISAHAFMQRADASVRPTVVPTIEAELSQLLQARKLS